MKNKANLINKGAEENEARNEKIDKEYTQS